MSHLRTRRKVGRHIPFGWKLMDFDGNLLVEVPEEQEALQQARQYIATNQYSLREVADWVTRATGRKISHVGLWKIFMNRGYI